jgi:hypothetical protein
MTDRHPGEDAPNSAVAEHGASHALDRGCGSVEAFVVFDLVDNSSPRLIEFHVCHLTDKVRVPGRVVTSAYHRSACR